MNHEIGSHRKVRPRHCSIAKHSVKIYSQMLVRNKRKGSLSPIVKNSDFSGCRLFAFSRLSCIIFVNEINNIEVLVSFICLQLKSDSKRESSEAPRPKVMH